MKDKLRLFCESMFTDWGILSGDITYRRNIRLYVKKSHKVVTDERKKISRQTYQIMWDDEILKTVEVEARDVLPNTKFNPVNCLPDSEDIVIAKKSVRIIKPQTFIAVRKKRSFSLLFSYLKIYKLSTFYSSNTLIKNAFTLTYFKYTLFSIKNQVLSKIFFISSHSNFSFLEK
ncbi:MAG: hypothetical protein MSH33_00935 [Fusobacterium necrophorum]|nr:hypothetical protein [Fusobacterium necrophorum]MDY2572693.1 hypothetical protein [Fusobacterium necrophorum]